MTTALSKNLREIPGFPGYFASADGCIWSGAKLWKSGLRPLKATLDRNGYLWVGPYVGKKRHYAPVHTLVLLAFTGPRPVGLQARHLDGNKVNNAAVNLLWGTQVENCQDKWRHGTVPVGQRHTNAKITDAQALRIRQCAATGEVAEQIARRVGLSPSQTLRVIHGACFAHLPGAIKVKIAYSGERHHAATLTDQQVQEIKAFTGLSQAQLARRFSTSRATIQRIQHGLTRVSH